MPSVILLNCFVQGGEKSFPIDIEPTKSVGHLQQAIFYAKFRTFHSMDADQLKLWLIDIDIPAINVKLISTTDGMTKLNKETDRLSKFFKAQPNSRNVHIFVEQPSEDYHRAKKARTIEDVIDRTDVLCESLIKPFDKLPTRANELPELIQEPFLIKLPVTRLIVIINNITNRDHLSYDEVDRDSSLAEIITAALSENVGRKLLDANTEQDMIWSLDSAIRNLLEFLCSKVGFRMIFSRDTTEKKYTTNTKTSFSTKKELRPDLLGYVHDVLMLKGEEMALVNLFDAAKGELLLKFSKLDPLYFGNIKFLICFAVAKNMINFYAIDGPTSTLVDLTGQLYMDDREGRFRVLKTVINIARILRTVVENKALPTQVLPLGKPMVTENSKIIVYEDVVVKTVSTDKLPFIDVDEEGNADEDSRVNTLRDIYNHAKGHRGLVQIDDASDKYEPITYKPARYGPGKYTIRMKTRGYHRMPTNENDLQVMIKSLLTGLSRFHDGGYVHRDIWSPNVLYVPDADDGYNYVLIDFEHAGLNGEKFEHLLTNWDDGTLEVNHTYTALSDMYQLGNMLRSFGIVISEKGQDFVRKLMAKDMTADDALQHEWII